MSQPGLPRKEFTPEQELKQKLRYSINQYRISVRWLRDAKTYKREFAEHLTFDGKVWQDTPEADLAEDAKKAYNEAIRSVLYWRGQIDLCNQQLINLVGKKQCRKTNQSEV